MIDSTGRKKGRRERYYADCVLMRVVFGERVPGPLPS